MIKVLFIGNSYTFCNEMNVIFENICKSTGVDVSTALITRGGARLDGYANPNTQSGIKVRDELKNHYDYVFLQEQSNLPVVLKDKFHKAVRDLYTEIKKYNSEVILYETWAKKAGHDVYSKYNLTVKEMEDGLFSAYEEIGKELNIKVSYVGRVFKYCTDEGLFDCYSSDKSHLSKIGSYIVAMCHYKTIFESLDNVNYVYEFDNEVLKKLKDIINKCCVER